MKSKLEIYALTVCFASVVCLIIALSIAGYSFIQMTYPALTIKSYNFDKYQTNDRYWESRLGCSKEKTAVKKPSDQELSRLRTEALDVEINSEKRSGLQTLVQALMFILAGVVTFFLHWRLAGKART